MKETSLNEKTPFLDQLIAAVKNGSFSKKIEKSNEPSTRNRLVYILLGVFFGTLGIHNFYAGRTNTGLAQLIGTMVVFPVLVLLTFGLGFFLLYPFWWLWPILEIILVSEDGDGRSMVM